MKEHPQQDGMSMCSHSTPSCPHHDDEEQDEGEKRKRKIIKTRQENSNLVDLGGIGLIYDAVST
jgi:hypothetical protein